MIKMDIMTFVPLLPFLHSHHPCVQVGIGQRFFEHLVGVDVTKDFIWVQEPVPVWVNGRKQPDWRSHLEKALGISTSAKLALRHCCSETNPGPGGGDHLCLFEGRHLNNSKFKGTTNWKMEVLNVIKVEDQKCHRRFTAEWGWWCSINVMV